MFPLSLLSLWNTELFPFIRSHNFKSVWEVKGSKLVTHGRAAAAGHRLFEGSQTNKIGNHWVNQLVHTFKFTWYSTESFSNCLHEYLQQFLFKYYSDKISNTETPLSALDTCDWRLTFYKPSDWLIHRKKNIDKVIYNENSCCIYI